MIKSILRSMLLFSLSFSAFAENLAIENVHPNTDHFNPHKGETLSIVYRINTPATIALQFFDGRDLLIKEIKTPSTQSVGEHTLQWDGKDQQGKTVPPEAYHFILIATTPDGLQSARYDLTDRTGNEAFTPRDIKWDAKTKRIHYVLDHAARVCVRVGLENNGPLMGTVVDWVARPGGEGTEAWDGKDASNIVDLAKHPSLSVGVLAYSLPDNSIIVGESQPQIKYVDTHAWGDVKRPHDLTAPKRMFAFNQLEMESRRDFPVTLNFPTLPAGKAKSIPVVTERTPIRLTVTDNDLELVNGRRFELVLYVDGQYAYENEVGFLPMTWNLDPNTLNNGEHYLTVNLRGYEGNFGIATSKIIVKKSTPNHNPSGGNSK